MGKIQVTVCEARDLYNMQHFGVPDPFVRVICGDKKYKTNVQTETLNPKWNETFDFAIADEQSAQVRFEIWNKNTFDDDLMGLYTLSLGGLTRQVVKDQWYTLEQSKTNAEIHLRVLALDFGMEVSPQDEWQKTMDITHDPVQRAIEDGRWRPGQQTVPVSSGPPVAMAQSTPVAVFSYPPATVSPYPPSVPPPTPQPYYACPQPSQPVYAQPQPAQPAYGYYPPQPYPPQPYPQYAPSAYPPAAPAPQPVYGYPAYPPAPAPPQPIPQQQQPMYAPQPGYRY